MSIPQIVNPSERASRLTAKAKDQPLYQDRVVHSYGEKGDLVVRTFNRYSHYADNRGLYLLRSTTGEVTRLGSTNYPGQIALRRAVDCNRLEALARRLSIMPLSLEQAKLRAEILLK